jgi:hypothetical protein
MVPEKRPRLEELLANDALIEKALQRAARQALRQHRLLGVPIATWRDGRVVVIPPEEIPEFPEEKQ